MAFLATIGKRFQDSGLEDILIESGVVAAGSINGVLSGHHYNRSMCTHKLMFEALHRTRWKAFCETLTTEEQAEITTILAHLRSIAPDPALLDAVASDDSVLQMFSSYDASVTKNRQTSPT